MSDSKLKTKVRVYIRPGLLSKFQDMADKLMTIKRHSIDPTIEHSIDGIVTEAGELADAAKRVKWYGTGLDKINVLEECGDLLFYLDKLIRACDSDFNEVIEMNMKKLAKRYKGLKFTEDQAVNRDTDKEREVLEGSDIDCKSCVSADSTCALRENNITCSVYKNKDTEGSDVPGKEALDPEETGVNIDQAAATGGSVEVEKTCNTCSKTYKLGGCQEVLLQDKKFCDLHELYIKK